MHSIPLFDAHCDVFWHLWKNPQDSLAKSSGHMDFDRVSGFAPYAQFFALFSDSAQAGPPMWERFLSLLELFRTQTARYPERIVHCRTAAQAQQAACEGRIAAFLAVEGAELLDCDPEKLDFLHKAGVRCINITWNNPNALSGTNCHEPERGLSQQGVCYVKRMRELGILIDVSHLSDPGFWDVLERSPGPIIATHSDARDVFFHTRNLTDRQITAIIEHQGVIGLNLAPQFLGDTPDVDTVLAHLERMLELGGERAVALGGDWDGVSRLPEGFRDISDWRVLHEELLRRNYPEKLVENLFYNNMMRIVREVCST